MKITQIVASLESRHGGPSRSVRGLATALAGIGHAVELLTTATAAAEPAATAKGLTVRTFPRQWPAGLAPSRPLRRHLDSHIPDIVHHHGLWLRTLHYAHRAAARNRVPLVISPRGMMAPWAWAHRRRKKALAERYIHPGAFEGARGWHATSDAEAADIRRLGFTQPICVSPNGVTPPLPAESAAARDYWRQQHPDLGERPTALFHSRFHPMKRVIETIDMWIQDAPKSWLLLMVGIPEKYSVEELRAYAYRVGGADRILVFDGTSRPPPYPVANLMLMPSHSENFGLVVAEALAYGVPALATDTTPWRQLETGGMGHWVPWDGFGQTMQALIDEGPDRLRERGEVARIWAREELGWEKAARTLARFYLELWEKTT